MRLRRAASGAPVRSQPAGSLQPLPRGASCHATKLSCGSRGRPCGSEWHQGVSLIGLGKPGRLRVDQPTITGELGPAPDAYTHYSPVMIAALPKTAGRSAFDEVRSFFCAKQEAGRSS